VDTPPDTARMPILSATSSHSSAHFVILDTYQLALHKSQQDVEALRVAKQVIEACDAVQGRCDQERSRAEDLIARAPR
jgi:hypothetical protein